MTAHLTTARKARDMEYLEQRPENAILNRKDQTDVSSSAAIVDSRLTKRLLWSSVTASFSGAAQSSASHVNGLYESTSVNDEASTHCTKKRQTRIATHAEDESKEYALHVTRC